MEKPIRPNFKELKETLPVEEVNKLRHEYREACDKWWHSTSLEAKDMVKRRSWVLLRKDKNGHISGYIENSFSMGFSGSSVRVWQSMVSNYGIRGMKDNRFQIEDYREYNKSQPERLQADCDKLNKQHPEYEFFVARVGSKNCPIKIDWKSYYKAKSKYEYRNIPFKVK